MKQTYFITGFPGFLAEGLLAQLFSDHLNKINHVYLLVLPSTISHAKSQLSHFTTKYDLNIQQFTLIEGDITLPDLGLDLETQHISRDITHVFHLAAIYDLAVPKKLAYKVNVTGTDNVNEWVKTLPQLERYIYFSTAYVAGKREGTIYETDLVHHEAFKNYYEETKYLAELSVEALKNELPITIIRPGIVKGHSVTGKTIKFDGLYFFLNFFDKLKYSPIIPMVGQKSVEGNFVPSDYVIKATSFLAIHDVGINKTYHLTDPSPYQMPEIYTMLLKEYLNRKPLFFISISLTKQLLNYPRVRKWLKVEKEAIDYFTYDARYDTTLAQKDLLLGNIECPDFKDTLPSMIEFYQRYKDDYAKHIKIK